MHLILITPAQPGSRAGNRATAERWQALLSAAGHRVDVVTEYHGEPCELFIALHAWRSAEAIRKYRESWPDGPLVVALTGTDIYRYQHDYPEPTLDSMERADVLIGLHDRVGDDIPAPFRSKLITLYQSADCPPVNKAPPTDAVQICVIGHLREEKDSLRAAMAARRLPSDSRIRVVCAGQAHNDGWRELALREQQENPRFTWLGQLNKAQTQALLTGSHAMVISSVMEGGANVVSEACRAGVPVIASDIPGNRGLLGDDYPGYFPARDDAALARLLHRVETDPAFLGRLRAHVAALATRFTPEQEQASLERALAQAVQRPRRLSR